METEVPDEWTSSRVPTAEEIRDILAPWRPRKIRKMAQRYLERDSNYIILRTHYGPGSDSQMAAILAAEEEGDESVDRDDDWWRVLDDAELFAFGKNCEKILSIIPELVGHQGQRVRRGLDEAELDSIRRQFSEFDQEDTLDQVGPIVDQIQKRAAAGNGPLFVADEQGLKDEDLHLQVFYLDGYGNVVRHSFVEPDSLGDMKVRESLGRNVDCWSDGSIGRLYRREGEMAARYYPQNE